MVDEHRQPELLRQKRLVRGSEIAAPFEVVLEFALRVAFQQHFHGIIVEQTRERAFDGLEYADVTFERL